MPVGERQRRAAVPGEHERVVLAIRDGQAGYHSGSLVGQPHVRHAADRVGEPQPLPGRDVGQHGPRYDQDLRFGAGNARGAFWVVDALEAGGYDGPVHFDYKPPRTEDDEGVWVSAAACMRNYLILREKVRAFRADPEVAEATAAARVPELSLPTLADGETWRDIRGFTPDVEALGERGMAFERLDQLALEYLYGVR